MAGRVRLLLLAGLRARSISPGQPSSSLTHMDRTQPHTLPRIHFRFFAHGNGLATCRKINNERLSSLYQILLNGNVRYLSNANDNTSVNSEVEFNLNTLTMKLERLGHLNLNDLSRAVESLEQCTETPSDADCLKLLQFTRKMMEDEYRPCASLVERVWQLTSDRPNGRLTIDHVVLYFHLCLLAESTNVSERDVLSLLATYEIESSSEVFEMLMKILGQQGDLAGARRVLSLMKEKNIPVTETTFGALILACGAERDSQGIQNVLDAMRSVHINLSSVTYGAMITAYSTSGQIAEMRQVVSQMKNAGVTLSQSQLASILLNLARSGQAGKQFENIDYIMKLIEESGVKVDLSRVVLQMIYGGQAREAMHLLPSLPLIRTNNHLYSNASLYLQEMVHARLEPDLIVEMCLKLQQEEINLFALHVALEYALKERWEELAWVLLKVMKGNNVPLREHYFWPLLHMNPISDDYARLLECVSKIIELGETPGFETLRDHVIPGLRLSQPELTMKMLQKAGLTATAAATPLLIVLIKQSLLDQAFKLVQTTKTSFSLGEVIGPLATAWHSRPRDITSLVSLLMQKRKEETDEDEDWGGQFLLSLAATRAGLNVQQIRPLFQELKKKKIGISEYSADLLVAKSNKLIQEAIKKNINLLLKPGLGRPPREQEYNLLPHPRNMNEEELEGHLVELGAKGLNTSGTLRRLLLHHASKNNTGNVLKLMERASEEGVRLSAGMLASVLMAYVSNGNDEAATSMLSLLQVEHPSFTLDSYKVVDLCTLLVQRGRNQEATEILKNYIQKNMKKSFDPKQNRRNCKNLLMASANSCSYEETQHFFSLLLSGGLVEADTLSLGTLVKSKLNSGDLRGAVAEVERIYNSYRCLPMRREVLVHLIKNYHSASTRSDVKDATISRGVLEDMLNIIARVNGSVSARHDLLFSYLEAGEPTEARKVLQNLAKVLDMRNVSHQLEHYVKTQQEDSLRHFLAISRGISTIDRQRIYSSLLNIYYVKGAGKKGLSLWTMMQEENLTPSPAFLTTLASLLAASNIKIPFQI